MTVTVKDIAGAVMLIIRLGVVARLIYCMIRIGTSEEESTQYKKRAKNVLIFYVIAESIWAIKDIIIGYYS